VDGWEGNRRLLIAAAGPDSVRCGAPVVAIDVREQLARSTISSRSWPDACRGRLHARELLRGRQFLGSRACSSTLSCCATTPRAVPTVCRTLTRAEVGCSVWLCPRP